VPANPGTPAPRRRYSLGMSVRGKKARVALALVALALGLFVVSARRFFFRRHFDVVSIAAAAEYQQAALLDRAFTLPVGATYRAGPIVFQTNPTVCGPTSVADVMRSLGDHDATPASVIEGSGKCGFFGICVPGLTLDELADLARTRTHDDVTVLRGLGRAQFHEQLLHVNDPSRRYIINFDRGPLFGTSGGHHSPIGGYLATEDLVLVIDVNAKYRPWLVKADRLYDAMSTVDEGTGLPRGMLLIQQR
jgi:hypothetical protein